MTNPRKVPEVSFRLQDLLEHQLGIPQSDLAEYIRAKEALHDARLEVETLGSLLLEKLIVKEPIETGELTAEIAADGKLRVFWGRE